MTTLIAFASLSLCALAALGDAPTLSTGLARLEIAFEASRVPRRPDVIQLRVTAADGFERRYEVAGSKKAVDLRLPFGNYRVVASAPRYAEGSTSFEVGTETAEARVQLRELRSVRAMVVDAESGSAISGAKVVTDNGIAGATDRAGSLVLEFDPEKRPRSLTLRLPGYGEKTVALPPGSGDVTLNEVALARGATITAAVHQTAIGQVVSMSLVQLRAGGHAPERIVSTLSLPESEEFDRSASFENVPPGSYTVVALGRSPGQRFGERVDVLETGVPPTVHLQVSPFRVRLRAEEREQPLDARVVLRQHDVVWETEVALPGGEAEIELWQKGKYSATIVASGRVPFREYRMFSESLDAEWVIAASAREVSGTVVDGSTGAAVPHAKLSLKMNGAPPDRGQMLVTADADDEGRFRFAPVMRGQHRLAAAARDYPLTELAYEFGADEAQKVVQVVLEKQPKTTLTVTDGEGRPLTGSPVYVFRGADRILYTRTGSDGTVPVFIPPGETRDLYVLPLQGSMGIIRVSSGTPTVQLTIPPGRARIVVRMESTKGEPIAGVPIDLGWNGTLLPPSVLEELLGRGARLSSGSDGLVILPAMPAGRYEIRPVTSARSKRGPAVNGALVIDAMAGEVVGVMTFAEP